MAWGRCMFCERPYDTTPGEEWGVVYLDKHGELVERGARNLDGAWPHCDGQKHHPLPVKRPAIVAIFGVPGSGKDSMLEAIGNQGTLAGGRGVFLELATNQAFGLRGPRRATEPGSLEFPYIPYEFLVSDDADATELRRVWVFNLAGEDFGQPDTRFREVLPFLPHAATLVLAVPPEALTGLAGVPGSGDAAIRERTVTGMQQIKESLREIDDGAGWKGTVVLALTKCDRYVDQPDFPRELLQDRGDHATWTEHMIDEQDQLARFLVAHGGRGILTSARLPELPVFLVAVSDTGNDDPKAAPSGDGDPTRSLDPVYLTLVREGIGNVQ